MKWNSSCTTGAAAGAGLLAAALIGAMAFRGCDRGGPAFQTPSDFAGWAQARGLRTFGEHVPEPYAVLASAGAGFEGSTFNAPGKGVISVVRIHPSTPRPDRPHRVWGKVLACGDEELLLRVERLWAGD